MINSLNFIINLIVNLYRIIISYRLSIFAILIINNLFMKSILCNRIFFIMILKIISSLWMQMDKYSNIFLMPINLSNLMKMISLSIYIKTLSIFMIMKLFMIINMNNFLQQVHSITTIFFLLIMIIQPISILILIISMLLSSKLKCIISLIIIFFKQILLMILLIPKIYISLFKSMIGIYRNKVLLILICLAKLEFIMTKFSIK